MAVTALQVDLVGDGSRGSVLIESDLPSFGTQIEELTSARAREFVLASTVKAGIKGLPGISRLVDPPYPVNSDGETIENLKDAEGNALSHRDQRSQPKSYRARYEVTARQ